MKWVLIVLCCGLSLARLKGQEAADVAGAETLPKANANAVQSALKQWVLTKQLISQEQADWAVKKESLADLNVVRKRETQQLAEFKKAATSRIAEIDEKRKKFSQEETSLKSWRRELKKQILVFEGELKNLLPLFPTPLKAKVQEAIDRLQGGDSDRPLQERTRDVLLVMQAYLNFQSVITLDADLRTMEGQQREVDVLYMGMTQAWYVDQTGKYSGVGTPSAKGWVWKEVPELAVAIRQAIEVQSRQATPTFVRLPFMNSAGGGLGQP
ncbi:MAG: DUF3450 domain-containing protein [Verrucomicrobiales bacterium]|nr:DUF3450 domain-containing protein [Verrucomicrobiales bacterium]